ncbi:hypothetical protein J7M02_00440 [Candidatus Aerophobetes bacterium]|nr:hypothetical protein [Candidatus Aerophobetes bacterium]
MRVLGIIVIASACASFWVVEIFNTPETKFIAFLGLIGCIVWANIEALKILGVLED